MSLDIRGMDRLDKIECRAHQSLFNYRPFILEVPTGSFEKVTSCKILSNKSSES